MRDAYFHTLALVLSLEDRLPQRLDPFVLVLHGLAVETVGLASRRHFEALRVLRGGFDRNDIVHVDLSDRKVRIRARGVPTENIVLEDEPELLVEPRSGVPLGHGARAYVLSFLAVQVGVEAQVASRKVEKPLQEDGSEEPSWILCENFFHLGETKDFLKLLGQSRSPLASLSRRTVLPSLSRSLC